MCIGYLLDHPDLKRYLRAPLARVCEANSEMRYVNVVPDASMIVPEKVDEASVLSERKRSTNSSRNRPTRPTQSERVAIAPPPALRAQPSRRPCMAAARSLAPAAHRLDCPTSQSCDRTRRHTPRRAASTPAPRGRRGIRPSLQQRARLEVTRQCERAAPHEPPSAMPSAAGGTAALEARSLFGGDALFGGEALLGARLCYGGRGSVMGGEALWRRAYNRRPWASMSSARDEARAAAAPPGTRLVGRPQIAGRRGAATSRCRSP